MFELIRHQVSGLKGCGLHSFEERYGYDHGSCTCVQANGMLWSAYLPYDIAP